MKKNSKTQIKPGKGITENDMIADDSENKKTEFKTLIIHGEKYKTTFTRKYENRKPWIKPDPRQIFSYIPGTVSELYVKEGQKVKRGNKMLILEAMKMLTTIEVPADGKISRINIKTGDRIPKGFLMIELE
jgi:biotin carboxyl carrier protein